MNHTGYGEPEPTAQDAPTPVRAGPLQPGPAPSADAPDLGPQRTLDPAFIVTERITAFIVTAAVVAGGIVTLVLDLIGDWWPLWLRVGAWIALALLAALLVWHSISWPARDYRATSYRYGRAGIEISRGVFWKRVINIPRSRIQHTDVTQGPLLRRYGMAVLTIHTAATRTPSISLAGLAHADALAVRDALAHSAEDEGV